MDVTEVEGIGPKAPKLGKHQIFHHALIANWRPEVRRFFAMIRKVRKRPGAKRMLSVVHDAERTCCAAEAWEETVKRIMARIDEKDGR